jgi:WD40 repeat protein
LTVRVWDITTGQADQTLTGHSSAVVSVAFSPDGKKVVSGFHDLTVRVWDITTGQALSPDGRSYSYSGPWLNWNGSRILYLPFDVRPYVTAFSGNAFQTWAWVTRVVPVTLLDKYPTRKECDG